MSFCWVCTGGGNTGCECAWLSRRPRGEQTHLAIPQPRRHGARVAVILLSHVGGGVTRIALQTDEIGISLLTLLGTFGRAIGRGQLRCFAHCSAHRPLPLWQKSHLLEFCVLCFVFTWRCLLRVTCHRTTSWLVFQPQGGFSGEQKFCIVRGPTGPFPPAPMGCLCPV